MAHIILKEHVEIGTDTIDAVSWQFAKDENFEKIIDESLKDTKNLEVWYSMLPKLPEDGEGYYGDLEMLYGRVKVHSGDYESEWYVCEPQTQRYQKVVVTQDEQDDILTDSDELGWWTSTTSPSISLSTKTVDLNSDSTAAVNISYVGVLTITTSTDDIQVVNDSGALIITTTATEDITGTIHLTATLNDEVATADITVNVTYVKEPETPYLTLSMSSVTCAAGETVVLTYQTNAELYLYGNTDRIIGTLDTDNNKLTIKTTLGEEASTTICISATIDDNIITVELPVNITENWESVDLYLNVPDLYFYMLPINNKEAITVDTNGTLTISASSDSRVTLTIEDDVVYINTTDAEATSKKYTFTLTATKGEDTLTEDIYVYIGQNIDSATALNYTDVNVYGYAATANIVTSGGDPTTDYAYNSLTYENVTFNRIGTTDDSNWTNGSSKAGIMLMRKTDYVTFFVRNAYATNENMFSPQPDTLEIWDDYDITMVATVDSSYNGTYNVRYSNKNGNPKIATYGWIPTTIDPEYAIPVIADRTDDSTIVGWYPSSQEAKAERDGFLAKLEEYNGSSGDDTSTEETTEDVELTITGVENTSSGSNTTWSIYWQTNGTVSVEVDSSSYSKDDFLYDAYPDNGYMVIVATSTVDADLSGIVINITSTLGDQSTTVTVNMSDYITSTSTDDDDTSGGGVTEEPTVDTVYLGITSVENTSSGTNTMYTIYYDTNGTTTMEVDYSSYTGDDLVWDNYPSNGYMVLDAVSTPNADFSGIIVNITSTLGNTSTTVTVNMSDYI